MLDNKELSSLRSLRLKLLHYWQKFPDVSLDKKELDNWQNVLDKVIIREQKSGDYSGSHNEKV